METGEWRLKGETINLRDFTDALAREYADEASVLGRRFVYESDLSGTENANGDKELLSRVFENLFSNAFRYTAKGDTVTLHCSRKQADGRETVLLQLRDTGTGIEKEQMEYIFDPFFRGTRSRREQGFGFGLSIVKSIIEAHGWEIGVSAEKPEHSTAGKGETVFSITIPQQIS
jgi:signal transduction histidine kinase